MKIFEAAEVRTCQRKNKSTKNAIIVFYVAVFLYYYCDTVMHLGAGFVVLFRLLFSGRREMLQQSKGRVESG